MSHMVRWNRVPGRCGDRRRKRERRAISEKTHPGPPWREGEKGWRGAGGELET